MNLLSFIATIVLAVTLIEGVYILLIDYRNEANRLFFFICMSISIWLFGSAFGYFSSTREEAFFWLKVSSPGYIFMHSLIFHFTLRYTNILKSRWIYLLYIPSIIFIYISLTEHLVFSDIHRSGEYWVMVPDYHSLSFYLFMVNYLGYYFIALLLLYLNIKRTHSIRIRNQSRIIFAAIILTITSYNVEPFLAPVFFDYNTYGQAPIYSIVWLSLIWYAISRYRFLGIYNKFLPFDFIDSLNEMVVIIDCNKKIIRINRVLQDKLEVQDTPGSLRGIFAEHELIGRLLNSTGEDSPANITVKIITPDKKTETTALSVSVLKDQFGDTTGFILTAREKTDTYSMFQRYGITEREFQIIKLIVSGNSNKNIADALNISPRTVETHITNIYNRLGLKNRSELINYCSELSFSV